MLKLLMFRFMKLIIRILLIVLLVILFAHFISDSLIFIPPPPNYQESKAIVYLPIGKDQKIAAYYLPNKNSKYTILVSHGNAEDIGTMMNFLHQLRDHGYSVLVYDYPGYGLSSGRPSEKGSYLAVSAAYEYLTKRLMVDPARIISYGHSLGAALALDLAVKKPVGGVILQSPFVSAYRVLTKFPLIPWDKFHNLSKVKKLTTPLLVIHGTEDNLVPFWHGKKLYDSAHTTKEFLSVQNAGHNDIVAVAGSDYWQVFSTFITKNLCI